MQETTATTFQAVQLPFPEQERLVCPRCDSTNTKFCYYNNYNLSQPRHFCRNCKRYWTKGGSLRNIPVGGSTRKNSSKRNPKRPNPDPIPDNNGLRQQRLQEPSPANRESSQSKHGTTANRQLGSLLQGASPNGSISGQEPGTDPRPGGGSEEDRVIMQEDGLVACAHFCRFL